MKESNNWKKKKESNSKDLTKLTYTLFFLFKSQNCKFFIVNQTSKRGCVLISVELATVGRWEYTFGYLRIFVLIIEKKR